MSNGRGFPNERRPFVANQDPRKAPRTQRIQALRAELNELCYEDQQDYTFEDTGSYDQATALNEYR